VPNFTISNPYILPTILFTQDVYNRNVYTDPVHNLYVADTEPVAGTVPSGSSLQPGEVTSPSEAVGYAGEPYPITLFFLYIFSHHI
jgi:hypothetical protein